MVVVFVCVHCIVRLVVFASLFNNFLYVFTETLWLTSSQEAVRGIVCGDSICVCVCSLYCVFNWCLRLCLVFTETLVTYYLLKKQLKV